MLAGADCRKAASKIDWYFTFSAAEHLFVRFPACTVMNPLFFARSFSGRSAVPVHEWPVLGTPQSMAASKVHVRATVQVQSSLLRPQWGAAGKWGKAGGRVFSEEIAEFERGAPSTLAALASARGGRLAVTARAAAKNKSADQRETHVAVAPARSRAPSTSKLKHMFASNHHWDVLHVAKKPISSENCVH